MGGRGAGWGLGGRVGPGPGRAVVADAARADVRALIAQ